VALVKDLKEERKKVVTVCCPWILCYRIFDKSCYPLITSFVHHSLKYCCSLKRKWSQIDFLKSFY
jgi:hypothetical protein